MIQLEAPNAKREPGRRIAAVCRRIDVGKAQKELLSRESLARPGHDAGRTAKRCYVRLESDPTVSLGVRILPP